MKESLCLIDNVLLAALRIQGRCRAAELTGLPGLQSAGQVAARLSKLARYRLASVEPGSPAYYSPAGQGQLPLKKRHEDKGRKR